MISAVRPSLTSYRKLCCNIFREPVTPLINHYRRLLSSSRYNTKARVNPIIMKIETPEFKSLFTPELLHLSSLFEKYGYEIRIAGGAVRDLLMGKQPKDLDFATVATPDEMKEMFEKEQVRLINMKGESHGTITPRINDKENFEVTTLRIDVLTDGRHAEVEFTKDWQLDANRRDLTINSMFLGLDGTVYDYFNGYEDLKKKRVVFVGNAEDRIREDYLRILRYFRFYGRIAEQPNNHAENILNVIGSNIDGLQKISGERIWSELRLILSGNFGPQLLGTMLSLGISPHIGLPEKPNIPHFEEVCSRTTGIKLNPMTYIASLLSDEDQVLTMNSRLKVSAYERQLALFVVTHREEKLCPKPLLPFQKIIMHTVLKKSDVQRMCVEVLLYNGHRELADSLEKWELPRCPVTGVHIKDQVPSKHFKRVLTQLKEYWADTGFKADVDDIMAQLPRVMEEAGLSPPEPRSD